MYGKNNLRGECRRVLQLYSKAIRTISTLVLEM